MKTKFILIAMIIANFSVINAQKETIFLENFEGTIVSNSSWFYPYWVSPTDGTYFGRTQIRVAQNAGLPSIEDGNGSIYLNTYNPTGQSFYGSDLISRMSFNPGKGLIFTVRAKMKTPIPSGIVGGIYLYDLTVLGMRGFGPIASSGDGNYLATVVGGGDIWTYKLNAKWVYRNINGPHIWQDIASSKDGKNLVAIEFDGYIWTSTNYGITWTKQLNSGINKWYAVASSEDGKNLVAVCLRGTIWTSTDYGVTWISHPEAGYRNWYDVASSPDGTKLSAVVYAERIWTSTNSGATWVQQMNSPLSNWTSVTVPLNDGTKLAATSQGGGVWVSTNSGLNWENKTGNINSIYLRGITSSKDGTKLAIVGNYGGNVWTSTDFGATSVWNKCTGPVLKDANYIASSDDGTKLAVSVFAGNVWTSDNFGVTWTNQSGSNQSMHDEIDFELLTKSLNRVHTNVYSNEPMGVGRPDSVTLTTPITEYHTYTIEWLPSGVTWKVDDVVIRTSTISPKGPMRFNLNMWVPASDWRAAYNGSLNYTTSISENKTYTMLVDWVRVDSLTDISTSIPDTKQSEEDVLFYPNPAHDLIYFNSLEEINVAIYNISGNVVLNKRKVSNGSLSISGLLPGIYIVQYEKNGIIKNSKLIVR